MPGRLSAGRGGSWAIGLVTLSGDNHRAAAANAAQQIAQLAPSLQDVRVKTLPSGSLVICGHYLAPDDPVARAELLRIKALPVNGRPIFARAHFVIEKQQSNNPDDPAALLSVRRKYPNVDPLYTLQVAVWGDFDSGEFTDEQIHDRAEAYCHMLRAQNMPAFYHHDDDQHLSIVTVGLFDHTALDPMSQLFSPEVEEVLRTFPAHLVNGEPLHEPISPKFPSRGTRIQQPKLVLVPMLTE